MLAIVTTGFLLNRMQYNEYLSTDRWKELASHCKSRAGNKCEMCGDKFSPLVAHHMRYDNKGKGNELNDLCCLCEICHGMFHSRVKIPVGSGLSRVEMLDKLHDTLELIGVNVSFYAKKSNRNSRRKKPQSSIGDKPKKKWFKKKKKKNKNKAAKKQAQANNQQKKGVAP